MEENPKNPIIIEVERERVVDVKQDGEVTVLGEGFNSVVDCYQDSSGDRIVRKEIGVRKIDATRKRGFSLTRAKELAIDIGEYYQRLKKVGVVTPPILDGIVQIIKLPEERGLIVSIEPSEGAEEQLLISEEERFKIVFRTKYAGINAKDLLKEEQSLEVIKQYVKAMMDILDVVLRRRINERGTIIENQELSLYTDDFKCPLADHQTCCAQVEVGIDPLPANFCVLGETTQFVDLFPSRYRKASMTIIETPHPKSIIGWQVGYWKHYTLCGILHIFFSQLCRIRPEYRLMFEELVLDYFKDSSYDCVRRYFSNSCWRKVRDAFKSICSIIDSMTEEDIYNMREIAGEFEHWGLFGAVNDDFQSFYRDAHFEDKLSSATVQKLKDRLLAVILRGKLS